MSQYCYNEPGLLIQQGEQLRTEKSDVRFPIGARDFFLLASCPIRTGGFLPSIRHLKIYLHQRFSNCGVRPPPRGAVVVPLVGAKFLV
jgi:hypothetical protein